MVLADLVHALSMLPAIRRGTRRVRQQIGAALGAVVVLPAGGPARGESAADDLSREATDPTASLMSFGFNADYVGSFHGPSRGQPDHATGLNFRPVIPFTAFGYRNILRLTMPYQVAGRGEEELKDVAVFDLVTFDRTWGRFAVGGVVSFATADAAADEVSAGPAIGFVRRASDKLNLGLFNQNLFAGDTAVSQLQPIIAYQLGGGWSASAGDAQFIYDWEHSRWLSLPIGVQIGKVTRFGSQPVRLSVNPQYNLADDEGLPGWSVKLGLTLLVPAK